MMERFNSEITTEGILYEDQVLVNYDNLTLYSKDFNHKQKFRKIETLEAEVCQYLMALPKYNHELYSEDIDDAQYKKNIFYSEHRYLHFS